jgi:hypothetical protein
MHHLQQHSGPVQWPAVRSRSGTPTMGPIVCSSGACGPGKGRRLSRGGYSMEDSDNCINHGMGIALFLECDECFEAIGPQ